MTILSKDILKGNLFPPEGYMDNYVIEGTLEVVENRLKTQGWDGKQPRAFIIIHFEYKLVKHKMTSKNFHFLIRSQSFYLYLIQTVI